MEFKPRRGISSRRSFMAPARYSGRFYRRWRFILHRGASLPPNSGVRRLVSCVNVYFNQLLEDEDFKPTMIQFLEIHQNWRHQRFREGILREELCNVMNAIRLNIDAWSKSYGDTSLWTPHFLLLCVSHLKGETRFYFYFLKKKPFVENGLESPLICVLF